ncbi:SDR family NAD(P)-dependent oxidoreductase [Micromonospora sp. FIMYZ51]|uniref:SDR family NAD(P)-dependent oxidoreductase n=1 Tax=Micromonospora sp. FIMYZ51 TaxID=3051832 RepID=UPI00311E60E0
MPAETYRTALDFLVFSPPGFSDPALAIAASRAGAIGVLDLQFTADLDAARAGARLLAGQARGRWGVLVDDPATLVEPLLGPPDQRPDVVVLPAGVPELAAVVAAVRAAGSAAFVVATDLAAAEQAAGAEADAVIAKGNEAGGWVGEETSFVLVQRCLAALRLPVWVQGGIGRHTVAACQAAGAAGVVLDGQVLLARESSLPTAWRARLRSADGAETVCLDAALGKRFRVLGQGPPPADLLRDVAACAGRPMARDGVLAVGQEVAFAADLARRFTTVGGIVGALRDAATAQCRTARADNPLRAQSPLARSHGTRFPLVQGPMTRVSDRTAFAAEVAEAGGLPFLALSLMRGPDVAALLAQTRARLPDRPWGVGILGFVPPELRAEQLAAIIADPPPFALIAGGRPDQARELEAHGIATYLHVPSPTLLSMYLRDGARRFVFEGRECGGHVGPRSSFVLWDLAVRTLLAELPAAADAGEYHVLLAGGIHDGRSGAMAAAIAAPLVARGIRVGALMGTAYLFTGEAVDSGAVTADFQQAALSCRGTTLLETGPGHATRCAPSPYVDDFAARKQQLRREGASPSALRDELERLNVGRLRIATKGLDRRPTADGVGTELSTVDAAERWSRGLYMIGQVAALRTEVGTVEELHREVAEGSAAQLGSLPAAPARTEPVPAPVEVAVIGMGCILPGAADLPSFWANILDKVDAITEVPSRRWDWRRYYHPDRAARDRVYSRWGGFIDEVPFDPVAFGMPPHSLPSIEPFQLLGLVVAQAALGDAGYLDRPFARDRTAVVLGAGGGGADLAGGYLVRSALPALFGDDAARITAALGTALPEWTEDSFPGLLVNVAAGRIANRLDLGGSNYTVDAACASSLAALHLGVLELADHRSDLAVVGGVDALQNPFTYLCFSKTQALSPSGRCRPFDASADGIAISEGFAAVVLKRLADAERDGDRIYAVIRGVGSSSDGRDRSLTAPRPEGQIRALRRAYAQADVAPATVGLVEAHGTGTVAGDLAESQALTTVWREAGADAQSCAVGSVKSMIGHTKATAGVVGLIKAALALHHKVLPATLGVTAPNAKADLTTGPLYVNSENRPWLAAPDGTPRRAGVSSFGFGGTNFHLVLEEYTAGFLPPPPVRERWPAELFVWRGQHRAELTEAVGALLGRLDSLPPAELPRLVDLAAAHARHHRTPGAPVNLALVATSPADLIAKLRRAREVLAAPAVRVHTADGLHFAADGGLLGDGRLAFLFPGQGSQYVDMGRDIALLFPTARESFEHADRLLAQCWDGPLSRTVFPVPAFTGEQAGAQQAALARTDVAQAALGALELAYLALLGQAGVEPDLVAGHSYGEFVALTAAGSLPADDLLRLSEARGRFIREESTAVDGAMAAARATPDDLRPQLDGSDLVVANLNAPTQTVVSGRRASVEAFVARCQAAGLAVHMLPVSCAFHSPLVAPARQRLAELLRTTAFAAPRIPVYANSTAAAYPQDPATLVDLLADHLVRPVRFVEQVEAMFAADARVFVEVGPRKVLSGLVAGILGDRPHLAVPVDVPGRPAVATMLGCLAALAAEGAPVDVRPWFAGRSPGDLDLAALANRPAARPGRWLVDGGRARPASTPTPRQPAAGSADRLDQLDPGGQQVTQIVTPSSNGNRTDNAVPSRLLGPPVPGPAARPAAPAEPAGTPATGRAEQVMDSYHQVMQQFLETQRNVMLAYLGAGTDLPGPTEPVVLPSATHRPPTSDEWPAITGAAGTDPAEPGQTGAAPVPAVPAPVATVPAAVVPAVPAARPAADGAPADEPGRAELGREELTRRLLQVVSDRTGYPEEMLSLDVDLEADLGIDSIKRVEIAGLMLQSLALPEGTNPDLESMRTGRTLREIVAAIEELTGSREQRPFEQVPTEDRRIGRHLPRAVTAPDPGTPGGLADGALVVVDGGCPIGAATVDRLRTEGRQVVRVVVGASGTPGADLALDEPADPAAVTRLRHDLRQHAERITGLVHLVALAPREPAGAAQDLPVDRVCGLFLLVRELAAELDTAAQAGGSVVLAATALGGHLGLDGTGTGGAADAALLGFVKSLAHEWPAVRVKAVDLAPGPAEQAAGHLLAELTADDGLVEVGYRDGVRTMVAVAPAELVDRERTEPLGPDGVLLAIGGARGITAETVSALVEHAAGGTVVLVGRSPAAAEEPATAGLTDPRELRRVLLSRLRAAGEPHPPAAVEAAYRNLLGQREAAATVRRLRAAGARVEYIACDVRDPAAFGALIDDVYARHGRIDGVIHGAGVIADRLVRDKQPDALRQVLATKLVPAEVLAARLRPDTLRFVVFFSSAAARYGNAGQADYAAANEVLNKLATDLDARWPARVCAVNWGPWESGMVTAQLRRRFAERGIALIPAEVGRLRFVEELSYGRKGETEVLIGGVGWHPTPVTGTDARRTPPRPLLARSTVDGTGLRYAFDLTHDTYLADHRLDGRPVVPFAMALELVAEAVEANWPTRTVVGVREMRLRQGIRLPAGPEPTPVEVLVTAGLSAAAEPPQRCAGQPSLPSAGVLTAEVTVAAAAQPTQVYYRATVELATGVPPPPVEPPLPQLGTLPAFPVEVAEAYATMLFHGPTFHGIAEIHGMDRRGARASLRPSTPARCMRAAQSARWLLDPILVDAALQVQVLWARTQWDLTLLPTELGQLRRYADLTPDGDPETAAPVRHELRIRPASQPPLCHADHYFRDADGRLLAVVTDMVGVGSRALHRLADTPHDAPAATTVG